VIGGGFIEWCAFSWEAFAQLVTGLAAVFAAFIIGRKQIAIQSAQTQLQSLSAKTALFDKRYAVFESTQKFLHEVGFAGQKPTPETQYQFMKARQESVFLFSPNTAAGLNEIYDKWVDFSIFIIQIDEEYKRTGSYGIGNPAIEKEKMSWFFQRSASLHEIFTELGLSGID
jgi:hypothetical protein